MNINAEFYDMYDGDAPEPIRKCISCCDRFLESETHVIKENGRREYICEFCYAQENPEEPDYALEAAAQAELDAPEAACECQYVDADAVDASGCELHGSRPAAPAIERRPMGIALSPMQSCVTTASQA